MDLTQYIIFMAEFFLFVHASALQARSNQIGSSQVTRAEVAGLFFNQPSDGSDPRNVWIVTNEYKDDRLARQIVHAHTFINAPLFSKIPMMMRENKIETVGQPVFLIYFVERYTHPLHFLLSSLACLSVLLIH